MKLSFHISRIVRAERKEQLYKKKKENCISHLMCSKEKRVLEENKTI
jgi:hypothetical protein